MNDVSVSARILPFLAVSLMLLFFAGGAEAATLRVNPSTGVYTVGSTFTVNVLLNTEGKSVNAADGEISFRPNELQVVGVSRAGSIFNLWTEEPKYSNSAGTVTFGGGSPTGYKGTAGTVMIITFRPLGAGTPKVNFKSGSVLAADGMGTNVLTAMTGGTYTISAPTENPEPEYITPANTPAAPAVRSSTHPDSGGWYATKTAVLSWEIPEGVTGVRTLLDASPSTIPTITYDELIREKTIEDLDEGVSYFHIQFRNSEGWGKITHYRIGVDTEVPQDFSISDSGEGAKRNLVFTYADTSPVREYRIQIDGGEPVVYADEEGTKTYELPPLSPGYHSFIIEAKDSAGNSAIATHSITINAFERPTFTEYPTRINTEVIPALKGKTRANADIDIQVIRVADGVETEKEGDLDARSDTEGNFVFIPDEPFDVGVYAITAVARDAEGNTSEHSEEIRLIVEEPGYIKIGSFVVSVLSVIIPLLALLFLAAFGSWYLWYRLSRWVRKVRKETLEVEESLTMEFNAIIKNLNDKVSALRESRKGKLTKAEEDLIMQMEKDLKAAKGRIAKEVGDIEDIVK